MDRIANQAAVIRGSGAESTGAAIRLPGGASGEAAYIDLPNGIISGHDELTVEGWVRIEGRGVWSRIFDFGSSQGEEVPPGLGGAGSDFLFLSAAEAGNFDRSRTEIGNLDPVGGDARQGPGPGTRSFADGLTEVPTELGSRLHHFAVTVAALGDEGSRLTTYRDGVAVGSFESPIRLTQLNDVNVWLGRSNFVWDPNFAGDFYELRIYKEALPPEELLRSFEQGPDDVREERGFRRVGDHIRDPTQLLDWLHMEASSRCSQSDFPCSVEELLADPAGWIAEGWRFATTDEIAALIEHWFGVTSPDATRVSSSRASAFKRLFGGIVGNFDAGGLEEGRVGEVFYSTFSSLPAVHRVWFTLDRIARDKRHYLVRPVSSHPSLLYRWDFSSDPTSAPSGTSLIDSLAGAEALVKGDGASVTEEGLVLPGGDRERAAYVELPSGILSQFESATLEGWVRLNTEGSWPRIFDFGSDTEGRAADFLFLGASEGTNFDRARVEIANFDSEGGGVATRSLLNGLMIAPTDPGEIYHFAVTIEQLARDQVRIASYRDGALLSSFETPVLLSQLNDVENWLGRSRFATDSNLSGTLLEFRVYGDALAPAEVAASFRAGFDAP